MMTFKDKYDASRNWKDRVKIIDLYHKIKIVKNKSWSIRLTAGYFDLSIGLICENLAIAQRFDLVEDCATRKDALLIIKKQNK